MNHYENPLGSIHGKTTIGAFLAAGLGLGSSRISNRPKHKPHRPGPPRKFKMSGMTRRQMARHSRRVQVKKKMMTKFENNLADFLTADPNYSLDHNLMRQLR